MVESPVSASISRSASSGAAAWSSRLASHWSTVAISCGENSGSGCSGIGGNLSRVVGLCGFDSARVRCLSRCVASSVVDADSADAGVAALARDDERVG
jgi:hypothetical protein